MVRMVESLQLLKWGSRFSLWARAATAGVAGAALAMPAWALSGGAGAAELALDSPWTGVGSLNVNGQLFSATLIAPGYVLTAAHVAAGAALSSIRFQTNGGTSFASGASAIYVNPGYTGATTGNLAGDPSVHADLAIIRLSEAAPLSVPVYSVFGGSLSGRTLSLVSYGGSATLATTGANRVDKVFADTQGAAQTYLFDFDGPDLSTNRIGANTLANGTLGAGVEASLVSGDSGSAAFVYANGAWQLAGVNTFQVNFPAGPSSAGSFGTGGGGVTLASQNAWIQSVVLAPVPEPETGWMLLTGLAMLGSLRKTRASRMRRHRA